MYGYGQKAISGLVSKDKILYTFDIVKYKIKGQLMIKNKRVVNDKNSSEYIKRVMIQLGIQEWQEVQAKLSTLQQQLIDLKHQNRRLKSQNQLLKNKFNTQFPHSNIPSSDQDKNSFSQHISQPQHEQNAFENSQSNLSNPSSSKPHSDPSDSSQPHIDHPQNQTAQSQTSKLQSTDHHQKPPSNSLPSLDQNPHISPVLNHPFSVNSHQKPLKQAQHNLSNHKSDKDINSITVTRKPSQNQLPNSLTQIQSSDNSSTDQLHLIEEICVFGPNLAQENLSQITFKKDSNQFLPPALYYPQIDTSYQNYGGYLFPDKCRVKPTQKSHIATQGNKILFKSSKKTDCSIFIFQGNQNLHPIKKPHEVLETVNPSKSLYGLAIEFNDFVFHQVKPKQNLVKTSAKKDSEDEFDQMYEMQNPAELRQKKSILLELNVKGLLEEQIRLEGKSLKDIEMEGEKIIMYRSTFCLCIFTYFPLVTYFQNTISAIFDEVKLKRIQNFTQTGELKHCDINYFIKEVQILAQKIKTSLNSNPVAFGRSLILPVNQIKLAINLKSCDVFKHLCNEWAPKLIGMMEREVFYEIYCMVMLEESVMFVCEDKRILTLMVLLFGSMLPKPFAYPYFVVSVLFSQELLQTPVTSIVGVNQSQEWLQNAIQNRVIDLEHKQVVMIGEKDVKVIKREKFSVPKSQNLKKVFSKFLKKPQSSSLSSILMNKSPLMRMKSLNLVPESNPALTNEQVFGFIEKLNQYYRENIFAHLPKSMKFERRPGEEINKVSMKNEILNGIEWEYKSAWPDYAKDEFLRRFVKTEFFSMYLVQEYGLDS